MGQVWKDWEVELFKEGLTDGEIMKKTGRNYASVDSKRYKLEKLGVISVKKERRNIITHTDNIKCVNIANSKHVRIDGQKLRSEFIKRQLKLQDVALEVGVASSTLSYWCSNNYCGKSVMFALQSLYNINPEDVRLEETVALEPEESNVSQEIVANIDYDKLGEIIYKSCKRAFKEVWSDFTMTAGVHNMPNGTKVVTKVESKKEEIK